jgi:hypothetical protein
MVEDDKPAWTNPVRVLIMASASSAWYEASDSDHTEQLLPRFRAILHSWTTAGARLVGSFDDDFFMVGKPVSLQNSMYMLFEVDDISIVVDMLHQLRTTENGVRLDKYIRMEARVGRRLYLLDN